MRSVQQTVAVGTLVIAALFFAAQPTVAHHSGAEFGEKVSEVTGTIKEFQFKNPHTWIQVLVKDANGKETEWSLEWGAPNSLARQGIRPTSLPAGAKVTMRLRQMRSGSPAGAFVGAKFEDGRTVGRWE